MLPEVLVRDKNALIVRFVILEDGFTSFGRVSSNKLVLRDISVSRHHGAFYLQAELGILTVEDYGSRNGTCVNNIQVRRKILYAGDVVQVGDFQLEILHGTAQPVRLADAVLPIRKD